MAGDTGEPGQHYIAHEKCNYGPRAETVLYSVDEGQAIRCGTSDKTDRDYILSAAHAKRKITERSEVSEAIMTALDDGEPHVMRDFEDELKAFGSTPATVRRAKEDLKKAGKVNIYSKGAGKNKVWYIEKSTT